MIDERGLLLIGFCPRRVAGPGFRGRHLRPDLSGVGDMVDVARAVDARRDVGVARVEGPDDQGWIHVRRAASRGASPGGEFDAPFSWGGLQILLSLSRVSARPLPSDTARVELWIQRSRRTLVKGDQWIEGRCRQLAWLAARDFWFPGRAFVRVRVQTVLRETHAFTGSCSSLAQTKLDAYCRAIADWEGRTGPGSPDVPALDARTDRCKACPLTGCPARVEPVYRGPWRRGRDG